MRNAKVTRTRFAPSPTGLMHVGNLRSALFSYLIAKHDGGDFILRIEDTDQNRYEMGAEEFIYQMMYDFHLEYDEGPRKGGEYGPYIQSERIDIYKKYADQLVNRGHAYYCFCDQATLNAKRMKANEEGKSYIYDGTCRTITLEEAKRRIVNGEKYVIRQKMPREGQTSYRDLVYGDITLENTTLDDQILMKSDGYPTYNFVNVIDDALMGITHVTRGCEYLASTPKYLLLYDALELPRPEFVHLPLVVKKDNTKLSKCNKDDNLKDLLEQGFLPEAILNYLALIGWSPANEKEFFTLDELIREFDISRIHTRPGCYDVKKLEWFNQHYIMHMSDDVYLDFVRPYLERFYHLEDKSEEWITKLLLLYKKQIRFGAEISLVTYPFFREEIELNQECLQFLESDSSIKNTLTIFKEEIASINDWSLETIENVINHTKERSDVTGKLLYMPIRIVTSGLMHGPALVDTIYLLGKDPILSRLKAYLSL